MNGVIIGLLAAVIILQLFSTALLVYLVAVKASQLHNEQCDKRLKGTSKLASTKRTPRVTKPTRARVTGSPRNIENSPKAMSIESVDLDSIKDDDFSELDDLESLDKELK